MTRAATLPRLTFRRPCPRCVVLVAFFAYLVGMLVLIGWGAGEIIPQLFNGG